MVDAFEIAIGEEKRMPKMNSSPTSRPLFSSPCLPSVVLGVITKKTDHDRLRYGLRSFAYFMAALFGLAWLMHFGHG